MARTEKIRYLLSAPSVHAMPRRFANLTQALVAFGQDHEAWEREHTEPLAIHWGSTIRTNTFSSLSDGEYIIAYLEGGDPLQDARVWLRRAD